jgi:hypothetical protein
VAATEQHSRNLPQISSHLDPITTVGGNDFDAARRQFEFPVERRIPHQADPAPDIKDLGIAQADLGKIRHTHPASRNGYGYKKWQTELGICERRWSAAFLKRLTHQVMVVADVQPNF